MWRSYFCALVATAVLAVRTIDLRDNGVWLTAQLPVGNESIPNRPACHV